MLHGHSGYLLMASDTTIAKACIGDKARAFRLQQQAHKQMSFRDPILHTPRVIEEFTTTCGASYCFVMERVHGCHPLALQDPLAVVSMLADFVVRRVLAATMRYVDGRVFTRKIEDVRMSILSNTLVPDRACFISALDTCARYFRDGVCLPIGVTHGDLTFCNMVVDASGAVYLVDFLDSFVSTPLADMTKLRQDTRHLWITLFDSVDATKLASADALLHRRFSEHACYVEHYDAWALLSLLRIVPYVRDARILAHVQKEVCRAHATIDMRR